MKEKYPTLKDRPVKCATQISWLKDKLQELKVIYEKQNLMRVSGRQLTDMEPERK